MIEIDVLEYLQGREIDGIGRNIFCEVPVDKPEEYIIVEKTAGGESDYIREAMVAVQSISSESLYRAMEINEAVKEAMSEMTDTEPAFSCQLNTDYNYTDTRTREYRYQAVFHIYF